MTIDRTSALPLWAQLLAVLRERLAAGAYADGFPTDDQLAAEFAVSRHTVRDAVRRLQEDGIVTRRRGVGSFVSPGTVEQPCGALYSLFRAVEAQGHEQHSDVLGVDLVRDADAATHLERPGDDELVRVERLRRLDGAPLAHDIAWLPAEIGHRLLDADLGHTGLYDALAARGAPAPDAGGEWILPVLPDPLERRLLAMPAREAAYRILRLGTAAGRPVEWRRTTMRADRYAFVARWSPTTRYEPVIAAT